MARMNLVITALVLVGVACLFSVVGYSIPYWQRISNGRESANQGLWQSCLTIQSQTICIKYSDIPGAVVPTWLNVVRAFVLLGILGAAAAAALTFMYFRTDSNLWALSSSIVALGSWLMLVIGVATYGNNRNGVFNLSASFYLVSLSDLLCLLAGILLLASWRLSPPGYQSMS